MAKQKLPIKIIGERDIILNIGNPNHHEQIVLIGKALSSPVRLEILNLLKTMTLSIQEIASALSLPVSSTASHIKYLEDAKLVVTETQPGIHGSMRVCICSMQTFHLDTAELCVSDNTITSEMPIGSYFQCDVQPTCGLADEHGAIGAYDSPSTFYSPNRTNAQLIWFQQGSIEYRFQNLTNPQLPLQEIAFSMELCSEAPGFHESWSSDITISINGIEIATYRSPGDFGARRGLLTPSTWPIGRTQYGLLKTFSVTNQGCLIDKTFLHNNVTIEDLHLQEQPYISLTISIKDTAARIGGVNLFGEKFGDHAQGIIMNLVY